MENHRLTDQAIVNRLPAQIRLSPLRLSERVDITCLAIILASSDEVLGIVDLGHFPVLTELRQRVGYNNLGIVRLRRDGKVCMAEAIRPFVMVLNYERQGQGKLGSTASKSE